MLMPPALAPWSRWLELFPRSLAQSVGAMVQRLDRAMGPLHVRSDRGDGEPDGFDGLTRRGSYERLLLTEWLLADELPEEFTRRAVMGEHAFYQPARRDPAGSSLSAALFDAGPDQLGSPRIAQLAALIVLARRAEAAGAQFRWGVLQSRAFAPLPGLEESITQFLNARSGNEACAADLEFWEEQFQTSGRCDDFWLLGGPRLNRLLKNRAVSRLSITDPLDPDCRELVACVQSPGGPDRTLRLPLPEERECGRLLRDPFALARTAPRRVASRFAPTSSFVWGQTGSKLLARAGSGCLAVYPLPNSPADGVGRPKLCPLPVQAEVLTAAGRIHRAIVAAYVTSEGALHIACIGGQHGSLPFGSCKLSSYAAAVEAPNVGLLNNCFAGPPVENEAVAFYTLLPNRLLVRMTGADPAVQQAVVDAGVQAFAPVRESGGLVYANRVGSDWTLQAIGVNRHTASLTRNCHDYASQVFFGCGGSVEHPDFGLAALEIGGGFWLVITDEDDVHLTAEPSQEVVGVIGPRQFGQSPGLVVIEQDRRTVRIVGQAWSVQLPRAGADIVHASASHAHPYIAYATGAGEVVVYSLAHEAELYRLEAGSR